MNQQVVDKKKSNVRLALVMAAIATFFFLSGMYMMAGKAGL